MKVSVLFVAVFAFAQGQILDLPRHGLPPAEPPKSRAARPVWGSILQRQDNFDPLNNNIWYMRYLENSQFFRNAGPIFIMLGAEWEIDEGWLQSGQMYDMAQEHGAYMFYTEHRYYGKSYPASDLNSNNLRFLTTEQALADIASFITRIKASIPALSYSKVVVFGGSYGGTMAVWMRELYPHLVHAAVSSSAPLLAKVDFHEYHSVVQRSLGQSCASVVTRGVEEAYRLLSMGFTAKVQQDFNLCYPVNTQNVYDLEYFFSTIGSQIGGVVQYATSSSIPTLCNTLQYPSTMSDYERLAAYSRSVQGCKGSYNQLVGSMTNTSLYSGNSRQWVYQTCIQYGFFQTSWSSTALYGRTIPVDLYNRWCLDFFGPAFTAAVTANGVAATNAKYGALNPKVTRVVSVHGTVDPWHAIGLSSTLNDQAPVIIVPGTSHCSDLNSLSSADSPEMYLAKLSVRKYVAEWLQQP